MSCQVIQEIFLRLLPLICFHNEPNHMPLAQFINFFFRFKNNIIFWHSFSCSSFCKLITVVIFADNAQDQLHKNRSRHFELAQNSPGFLCLPESCYAFFSLSIFNSLSLSSKSDSPFNSIPIAIW